MTDQTTETSLRVSRVIKAPRERVYQAWLDSESPQMRRAAPNQAPGKPMSVEVHKMEPRVGGEYRVSMIATEGEAKGTHTVHGRFLELVPNEKIVRTHAWEGEGDEHESRVTITFRDVPGGTEVMLLHEGLPDRETATGHAEGWGEALENLASVYEAG